MVSTKSSRALKNASDPFQDIDLVLHASSLEDV